MNPLTLKSLAEYSYENYTNELKNNPNIFKNLCSIKELLKITVNYIPYADQKNLSTVNKFFRFLIIDSHSAFGTTLFKSYKVWEICHTQPKNIRPLPENISSLINLNAIPNVIPKILTSNNQYTLLSLSNFLIIIQKENKKTLFLKGVKNFQEAFFKTQNIFHTVTLNGEIDKWEITEEGVITLNKKKSILKHAVNDPEAVLETLLKIPMEEHQEVHQKVGNKIKTIEKIFLLSKNLLCAIYSNSLESRFLKILDLHSKKTIFKSNLKSEAILKNYNTKMYAIFSEKSITNPNPYERKYFFQCWEFDKNDEIKKRNMKEISLHWEYNCLVAGCNENWVVFVSFKLQNRKEIPIFYVFNTTSEKEMFSFEQDYTELKSKYDHMAILNKPVYWLCDHFFILWVGRGLKIWNLYSKKIFCEINLENFIEEGWINQKGFSLPILHVEILENQLEILSLSLNGEVNRIVFAL